MDRWFVVLDSRSDASTLSRCANTYRNAPFTFPKEILYISYGWCNSSFSGRIYFLRKVPGLRRTLWSKLGLKTRRNGTKTRVLYGTPPPKGFLNMFWSTTALLGGLWSKTPYLTFGLGAFKHYLFWTVHTQIFSGPCDQVVNSSSHQEFVCDSMDPATFNGRLRRVPNAFMDAYAKETCLCLPTQALRNKFSTL